MMLWDSFWIALGSLRGIAMIIGPGMFSGTFAIFIARGHSLPGAPWFLAALLLLASLVLARVVVKPKEVVKFVDDIAEQAAAR